MMIEGMIYTDVELNEEYSDFMIDFDNEDEDEAEEDLLNGDDHEFSNAFDVIDDDDVDDDF